MWWKNWYIWIIGKTNVIKIDMSRGLQVRAQMLTTENRQLVFQDEALKSPLLNGDAACN